MLVKRIPKGQGQRICIGSEIVIDIKRASEGQVIVTIKAPMAFRIDTRDTQCGIELDNPPPNVVVG